MEWSRARQGADPLVAPLGVEEYRLEGPGGRVETAALDWAALGPDLARLSAAWDAEAAQRVGERLRALLGATAGGRAALEAAEGGAPFALRAAAAELLALPWGLCAVGPSGRRLMDLGERAPALSWPGVCPPAPGGGAGARGLLVWSDLGGPVPWRAQAAALQRAWTQAGLGFDPTRDVRRCEGLAELQAALGEGGPPVALHLLAHGGQVGRNQGIYLGNTLMTGDALAAALAPHRQALRLVVLAVCGGAQEALGVALGSPGLMLHRAGIARVVGARAPLTVAGANALTEGLYTALLGELRDLDQALGRAARALEPRDRAVLTLYAAPDTPADQRPVPLRPYRGLLAYGPGDTRFFFGRGPEVQRVRGALAALQTLGRPPLLVVTGASGSGKSSVVLAGVVGPAGSGEAPDQAELSQMQEALARLAARLPDPAVLEAAAALARARPPGALRLVRPSAGAVEALAQAEGAALVVVDQLEELFTHLPEPDRQPLVDRLLALAAAGVPVLATLRVDLLGRLGELRGPGGQGLDRLVMDPAHHVYVPAPDAAALREIIVGPAQAVGLEVEPALTERLLAALDGAPGGLPLLSLLLDALWLRRADGRLGVAALDGLGGVPGALERLAEQALAGLDLEAARAVLVALVEPGLDGTPDLRRRADRAALEEAGPGAAAVITRLIAERVLVAGERGGAPTVELAHEALIRGWPRLQGWVEAERGFTVQLRALERWAQDWRDHGALLDAPRLAWAETLSRGAPRALPGPAQALLEASRAALAQAAAAEQARARGERDLRRMREAEDPRLDSLDRARRLLEVEDPTTAGWAQAAVDLLCAPRVVARYGDAARPLTHARFGPGGVWLGAWDGAVERVGDDGRREALRAGDGRPGAGEGRILGLDVGPQGELALLLRPPEPNWEGVGPSLHLDGGVVVPLRYGRPNGPFWLDDGRVALLPPTNPSLVRIAPDGRVEDTRIPPVAVGERVWIRRRGEGVVVRDRDGVLRCVPTGEEGAWGFGEARVGPHGRFTLDPDERTFLAATPERAGWKVAVEGPAVSALGADSDEELPLPTRAAVRDLALRGPEALLVSTLGVASRWAWVPALRRCVVLGGGAALAGVEAEGAAWVVRAQDGRRWRVEGLQAAALPPVSPLEGWPEPAAPPPGHEDASSLVRDAQGGVLSERRGRLHLSRPGWPLLTLVIPGGPVLGLGLDGGRLAAACADGLLWCWTLPATLEGLRERLAEGLQAASQPED